MTLTRLTVTQSVLALGLIVPAAVLSGCATGLATQAVAPVTTPAAAHAIGGYVHGGQSPVDGATIGLYAVGIGPAGTASTNLLTTAVSTSQGSFLLTGKYTPCTTGQYIYLTATQGNPGSGSNNPSLAMMAAMGECSTLSTSTFINVDELTTVAAAFALAPFTADYTHISYLSTNTQGIANAFANAATLANFSTGLTPGPNKAPTATLPTAEINTLADIAANCINASGTCASLFAIATDATGTQPTDTLGALHNIVLNPTQNVAALYNYYTGIAPATMPYQGTLNQQPADWSLAITNTGSGLATPWGLAIDGFGNVWVTNESGSTISKFSPNGTPLSGTTGYAGVYGARAIAIDLNNNAWVANSAVGNVIELGGSGAGAGTVMKTVSAGGIDSPVSIAVDPSNNIWVANYNSNSIAKITNAGAAAANSPFTDATIALPTNISIDPSGNAYVSSAGTSSGTPAIVKLSPAGVVQSGTAGYTDGTIAQPLGVGIDQGGNLWIADNSINSVSLLSGTGSTLNPAITGVSTAPANISFAGIPANSSLGDPYISNNITAGSITQINPATFNAATIGTLNQPYGLAVSSDGSVWTANSGSNTVTQFVGLAVPVVTPLVRRTP